jgi:hypothetical protein
VPPFLPSIFIRRFNPSHTQRKRVSNFQEYQGRGIWDHHSDCLSQFTIINIKDPLEFEKWNRGK